jgi:hypothetical protein
MLEHPASQLREVIGENSKRFNAVIAVRCKTSRISKYLKTWSGRRGSNPRRPAWELGQKLQINNLLVQGFAF